jgi:hypothetical protein
MKVTGACAGVGFMMGFIASVVYHLTPVAGRFRTCFAVALGAPAAPIPILCVVSDGPEMLALATRYHLITVWVATLAVYCSVSLLISVVRWVSLQPDAVPGEGDSHLNKKQRLDPDDG